MHDISGRRFGRLVAVRYVYSKNHRRFWECICDCGAQCIIRQDQLTTGKTRSCGCLSRDVKSESSRNASERKKAVAEAKASERKRTSLKKENPRLYRIWHSMKSRCYYSKNKCFNSYGGRGISVCDSWKLSFNEFAMWALANGYSDTLTIDRIDVNGNYCPQNCRWITNLEQQHNKRKTPPQKREGVSPAACVQDRDAAGNHDTVTHEENIIPRRICQAEVLHGV